MQCRMLNENGIEVTLSRDELHELDITYEQLDYANTETRRVLWTVLDEAGALLGRNIDLSGKMLIEARPDGDGGCILDFTLYPQKRGTGKQKKINNTTAFLLFETDQTENLLQAVCAIGTQVQGDLFLQDGVFRLLLTCAAEQVFRLTAILSEFGSLTSPDAVAAAATREYWQCVCENAVQLLHSYAMLRESKDVQS